MRVRPALLAAAPALLTLPLAAGPALAHEGGEEGHRDYSVRLVELNDTNAEGTAALRLSGTKLTVQINTSGLVPGVPHAQHLHGSDDGRHDFTCPTMDDDRNGDGVLTTAEGLSKYGNVFISLTTKGDTSVQSGLAVDRFPVADAQGNLRYERTIEVSQATADNLANLHVVQHGIDKNGNGKYDFEAAGKSELDPKLPQEATAIANCGTITGATVGAVPTGGVETGSGGTEGVESPGLLALGGAALAAAAGLGHLTRRRIDRTR